MVCPGLVHQGEDEMKKENETWTGVVTAKEWVCATKGYHSFLCRGNPNEQYHDMRLDGAFHWDRTHYVTPIMCATRYHARQVCKEWNDLVRKTGASKSVREFGLVYPLRVRFRMETV